MNIFSKRLSLYVKQALFCISMFLLFGCNQNLPPIEADDFGYPKYTIYAKGLNVKGEKENQLSDWVKSGYKYNGDQMVIMVYNKKGSNPAKYIWNPWLCEQEEDICITVYEAGKCCFGGDTSPECTGPKYCINPKDRYETISEAACYFEKGEGLYLLITDPANTSITNPNTYDSVNRLPSSAGFYTKSLWDETTMWNNGERAGGYSGELIPNPTIDPETGQETLSSRSKESYINGEAYFKILDRYYEDNSGHLHVVLKRGFDRVIPPPISTVTSFITETMNDTSEELYKQIARDWEYRLSLKILLVLYIVVHGILFIGGVSNMTQREFVNMFIKLIIVVQLLTGEDSWKLFNDYFFKFFTNGLNEIIGIITIDLNGAGNGMTFFDSLLSLLFSYETNMKIQALIWSFPSGFVVAFIMYAAILLFTVAIAKAVMLYLLAYMAISLLIIVAPIFICFMLFESTKPLFEGWLKQFVIFFMQTVLVFSALNLMAQMIVDQIYMILGFKACYESWIDVFGFTIAKNWFICEFFDQTDIIEVPGYGYNDSDDPDYFCQPFECTDERYVDLPFLDPDIPNEKDLIDDFKSPSHLNIPMLYNSSILLLMCYLMMKFNDVVPGLGKAIAGGSAVGNSLATASGSFISDFRNSLSGLKNFAAKSITGKSQYERELVRRSRTVRGNLKTLEDALKSESKGKLASAWNAVVAAPGKVYDVSGKISNIILPPSLRKVVYQSSGFIKDMMLPPGSMMLGTPEERARRIKELKNAREGLRRMDEAEGRTRSKSYRDQIVGYLKKKTGIAEMNRRVEEFNKTYYDKETGEFLFKEAAKGIATTTGRWVYSTDTGKSMYDAVVKARNGIVDEYRAVFTKEGREERERNRIIDNKISRLAEQYQRENPLRDRNDRVAFERLDKNARALNIDKAELFLMSGEEQRNYVARAYNLFSADKRVGDVEAAYQSMLQEIANKGVIVRSMRDVDPAVIRREAYDTMGINRTEFEALNTKQKLESLNKAFRNSNLDGSQGEESYRAYRYLKDQLTREREIEKIAAKEEARRNSFIGKADAALNKVKNIPSDIVKALEPVVNILEKTGISYRSGSGPKRGFSLKLPSSSDFSFLNPSEAIKRGLEKRGIKIEGGNISVKVGHLEGDKMDPREAQLYSHNIRYNREGLTSRVDVNNADAVLHQACANVGISEATIQSISPERRLQYIENAIRNNVNLDQEKDFEAYKSYRDLKEIVTNNLIVDPLVVERELMAQERAKFKKEQEDRINSYSFRYEREKELSAYKSKYMEEKDQRFTAQQVAADLGMSKAELLKLDLLSKEDQLEMITDKSVNMLGLDNGFKFADKQTQLQMLNNAMMNSAIDLNQGDSYLAYSILKRNIGIDEVVGNPDDTGHQIGVKLGISDAMFGLVTDDVVRAEMLREKAASVLGISEADIQAYSGMSEDKKLSVLDKALKDGVDLNDEKTYLAYKLLKDEIKSNNPFDEFEMPVIKHKENPLNVGNDEVNFINKDNNGSLFKGEAPVLSSKESGVFDEDSSSILSKTSSISDDGVTVSTEKLAEEFIDSTGQEKLDLVRSDAGLSSKDSQSFSYDQKYEQEQKIREINQRKRDESIKKYAEEHSLDSEKLISSLDQGNIIAFYEQNKDRFAGAKFAVSADEAGQSDQHYQGLQFAMAVRDELYGKDLGLARKEADIVFEAAHDLIKDTLDGRINPDSVNVGGANDQFIIDRAAEVIGLSKEEVALMGLLSKEDQEKIIEQTVRKIEYNNDNADRIYAAKKTLSKMLRLDQRKDKKDRESLFDDD